MFLNVTISESKGTKNTHPPTIENEMQEFCPLCGDPGSLKYSHLKDRLFGAKGEWAMKMCLNPKCGVFWLSLRPKNSEISKAYSMYYTHADRTQKSLKQKILANAQSFLVSSTLFLTGSRKEKLSMDNMFLENLVPGTLLEIGCGDGAFLVQQKNKGWQVEGLDQDEQSAKLIKEKHNINIHVGSLEKLNLTPNTYDAIVMKHVAEHLYDLQNTLKIIYNLLKPGGQLTVVTPNPRSWSHQKFGQDWRALEPPRHLFLYSSSLLSQMASVVGFQIKKSETLSINSWLVLSESFELRERPKDQTAVRSRPKVKNILKSIFIQFLLLLSHKFNPDLGDECVLVAIKPDSKS